MVTAGRPLTQGETGMARTMFGDSIDYARVRLVRRRWWPFQPKGIVMAPSGNIHFHPEDDSWREDFSTADWPLQGLFIHEMTHVWQAQKAGRFYLPLMRHPFCRYAYSYREGRPFLRYGLEQQAELVRHAYLQRRGIMPRNSAQLAEIERILPFTEANSSVSPKPHL